MFSSGYKYCYEINKNGMGRSRRICDFSVQIRSAAIQGRKTVWSLFFARSFFACLLFDFLNDKIKLCDFRRDRWIWECLSTRTIRHFNQPWMQKAFLMRKNSFGMLFCCLYETFHMKLLGGSEGVECYRSIKLSKKSTNSKDKFYIINAT